MKVRIKNKLYGVKFGFGCYRRVCEAYGKNKISDFDKLLADHDIENMDDPTFKQQEFISCFIISAIKNDKSNKEIDFDSDDLFDEIIENPSFIEDVFKDFQKSQVPQTPVAEKK